MTNETKYQLRDQLLDHHQESIDSWKLVETQGGDKALSAKKIRMHEDFLKAICELVPLPF